MITGYNNFFKHATGTCNRSSKHQIHKVTRESSAWGQFLQQSCIGCLQYLTSNISSLETSILQCPPWGCRFWSSSFRIFSFCTRSRLYFGTGESFSLSMILLMGTGALSSILEAWIKNTILKYQLIWQRKLSQTKNGYEGDKCVFSNRIRNFIFNLTTMKISPKRRQVSFLVMGWKIHTS